MPGEIELRDGGRIDIRPIAPSDARHIQELHARLSDRTRFLRFFSAYPRIPPADLHRFVTVDHHDREALVAVVGADIVAVARYERIPPGSSAEVAFVIDDAYQRRGIAPILLEALASAARSAGLDRFVAEVLPGNAAMMKVLNGSGYEVDSRFADGVIHVTFDIATPPTG